MLSVNCFQMCICVHAYLSGSGSSPNPRLAASPRHNHPVLGDGSASPKAPPLLTAGYLAGSRDQYSASSRVTWVGPRKLANRKIDSWPQEGCHEPPINQVPTQAKGSLGMQLLLTPTQRQEDPLELRRVHELQPHPHRTDSTAVPRREPAREVPLEGTGRKWKWEE